MRRLLVILGATAAWALSAGPLRAGIDWSYFGDKEVAITSGSATVKFLGTAGAASNNSGVVLYNLTASSSAPNNGPADHFDKVPFTLNVSIVDEKARVSATGNDIKTLPFTGYFTADLTKGTLTNWSVEWETPSGLYELGNDVVGMRKYELLIDGFLPPSPDQPTENGMGTVHADVKVSTMTGGGEPPPGEEPPPSEEPPPPSETPEPSSVLLAGIALGTYGVWKRRRKVAKLFA